jgi:uncharacterized protein DUF3592
MLLLKIQRSLVLAVLTAASLCMCVTAGGLLGFLLGYLCLGMTAHEALIAGVIGVMGGIVGTPLCVALLRERWQKAAPSDAQGQDEFPGVASQPSTSGPADTASVAAGNSFRLRRLLARIGWLLLLPTLPAAIYEWYVWAELQSNGRPVQAEITSLGSSSSFRTAYHVSYEFQLPNGEAFHRTQEVSKEFQAGLRLGGQLPVLYLPTKPSVSRLAEEDTHRMVLSRMAGTWLAVYLLILGAFLVSRNKPAKVLE